MGKGGVKFSGFTCVKYIFFTFNVLFWLLGCTILGIGIWLHIAKGNYAPLMPNFSYLSASALCMSAGAVMLLVGFFGCCGAIMEHQCLLITYFLLLVVIFLMEMVAGILAFVYRDEVERIARRELTEGIREHYPSPDSGEDENLRHAWQSIQQELKCCGVTNYTDWYESNAWKGKNYVPQECCTYESPGCGRKGIPSEWHQKGCLDEVKYWLKQHLYVVGVFGLVVGVLQVLGMVASMALFCCLRSDKEYI